MDGDLLEKLGQLGYDRAVAAEALRQSDNEVQAALDSLADPERHALLLLTMVAQVGARRGWLVGWHQRAAMLRVQLSSCCSDAQAVQQHQPWAWLQISLQIEPAGNDIPA